MNIIDKISKKLTKKVPEKVFNEYYRGNDCFLYFPDVHFAGQQLEKTRLSVVGIINNIDGEQISTTLYKCYIGYSYGNSPILEHYDVLIQFDFERMKTDKVYAQYIFTQLLEKNRMRDLYNITVGKKDGKSLGKYIGSVITTDQNLSIEIDNKIGEMSANSLEVRQLKEKYQEEIDMKKFREEHYSSLSEQRKQLIARLYQEIATLEEQQKQDDLYDNDEINKPSDKVL